MRRAQPAGLSMRGDPARGPTPARRSGGSCTPSSERPAPQLFAPGADAVFRLAPADPGRRPWSALLFVGARRVAVELRDRRRHRAGAAGAVQPQAPCGRTRASTAAIATSRSRRSATAGIPPTWTCMTCHSQIWTGAEMLAPVRDSLADNSRCDGPAQPAARLRLFQPLDPRHQGRRLLDLPRRGGHDAADLQGQAVRDAVLPQLPPQPGPVRAAARRRSGTWHWSPPADQAKLGAELVAAYHIGGAARLTDCSICHR